jgi:hypothetical protein
MKNLIGAFRNFADAPIKGREVKERGYVLFIFDATTLTVSAM